MPQLRMRITLDSATTERVVALPDGYRFVDGSKQNFNGWLELLNRDGEFGIQTMENVRAEILDSLIPDGAVLVASGNEIVACASACFARRFSPDALMNYVLVRADHRGLGLGRAASVEAMKRAHAKGYQGMILQTDDTRDAAIGMYLRLGFRPVMSEKTARRWTDVLARLG